MKNLIVATAVLILTLLLGCQENMISEPGDVLLKRDPKTNQISPDTASNTIRLNYSLVDPTFGSCKLQGRVVYRHQILEFNEAMSPIGLKQVALQIYFISILDNITGMLHQEWRVEEKSEDVLYISEDGIFMLEKSYWITNRDDAVLLVKYLVTTNGVGISSVTLVPIEK